MSQTVLAPKCKSCAEEVTPDPDLELKADQGLVHPRYEFCSPECTRNYLSTISFNSLRSEKIMCVEEDKSCMSKIFNFQTARTQDNTLMSLMAIAHTLFTTDKARELFTSDEYKQFVEQHKGRTFTYQDGDVMMGVVVHELFEALHTRSITVIPRTINSVSCLNYISEQEPILVLRNSALDDPPNDLLTLMTGICGAFHSLESFTHQKPPAVEVHEHDETPEQDKQLDGSDPIDEGADNNIDADIFGIEPRLRLTNYLNIPIWLFPFGTSSSVGYTRQKGLDSKEIIDLTILFNSISGIKLRILKAKLTTTTLAMVKKFIKIALKDYDKLWNFVFVDNATQKVLPDSAKLAEIYNSTGQQKELLIMPEVNSSEGSFLTYKIPLLYKYNNQRFYFYADVECKASEIIPTMTQMLKVYFTTQKDPNYEFHFSLVNQADPKVESIKTAEGKPSNDLNQLVIFEEGFSQTLEEQAEELPKLKPSLLETSMMVITKSQGCFDPKTEETLFYQSRLTNPDLPADTDFPDADPTLMIIQLTGTHLELERKCLLENGLPLRSATPEVAQGKYFLHAILLKNQDVVETVILKGQFRTIKNPESNYKFWSNRQGEQEAPLTDAISKAFALVYELRTSNGEE
jgi:hypothetical protein